jgi:hypothetical protein
VTTRPTGRFRPAIGSHPRRIGLTASPSASSCTIADPKGMVRPDGLTTGLPPRPAIMVRPDGLTTGLPPRPAKKGMVRPDGLTTGLPPRPATKKSPHPQHLAGFEHLFFDGPRRRCTGGVQSLPNRPLSWHTCWGAGSPPTRPTGSLPSPRIVVAAEARRSGSPTSGNHARTVARTALCVPERARAVGMIGLIATAQSCPNRTRCSSGEWLVPRGTSRAKKTVPEEESSTSRATLEYRLEQPDSGKQHPITRHYVYDPRAKKLCKTYGRGLNAYRAERVCAARAHRFRPAAWDIYITPVI